ncbi:MAG: hypothetical protein BWY88_00164 [Synergistetes bacterium ADurb.Bin520]|nr:MAG: hypothetical protein BWY88_00164 [Synergistetes bacterium ADurb.Bin520]
MLQQILLVLRQEGILQETRHAQDRIQGGPNFVAHVRQEDALGPIGPFGLVPGRPDRFFDLLAMGDVYGQANHPIAEVIPPTEGSQAGFEAPSPFVGVLHGLEAQVGKGSPDGLPDPGDRLGGEEVLELVPRRKSRGLVRRHVGHHVRDGAALVKDEDRVRYGAKDGLRVPDLGLQGVFGLLAPSVFLA